MVGLVNTFEMYICFKREYEVSDDDFEEPKPKRHVNRIVVSSSSEEDDVKLPGFSSILSSRSSDVTETDSALMSHVLEVSTHDQQHLTDNAQDIERYTYMYMYTKAVHMKCVL